MLTANWEPWIWSKCNTTVGLWRGCIPWVFCQYGMMWACLMFFWQRWSAFCPEMDDSLSRNHAIGWCPMGTQIAIIGRRYFALMLSFLWVFASYHANLYRILAKNLVFASLSTAWCLNDRMAFLVGHGLLKMSMRRLSDWCIWTIAYERYNVLTGDLELFYPAEFSAVREYIGAPAQADAWLSRNSTSLSLTSLKEYSKSHWQVL